MTECGFIGTARNFCTVGDCNTIIIGRWLEYLTGIMQEIAKNLIKSNILCDGVLERSTQHPEIETRQLKAAAAVMHHLKESVAYGLIGC